MCRLELWSGGINLCATTALIQISLLFPCFIRTAMARMSLQPQARTPTFMYKVALRAIEDQEFTRRIASVDDVSGSRCYARSYWSIGKILRVAAQEW